MFNQPSSNNHLDDLFIVYDSIDLSTSLKKSMDFLASRISCVDILWIQKKELQVFEGNKEFYKISSSLEQKLLFTSQADSDFSKNKEFLAEIDSLGGVLSEVKESRCYRNQETQNIHFQIPVFDNDKNVAGYFLFQSIERERKAELWDKVSEVVKYMNKHIGFCITHYKVRQQSFTDDVTELYNQRYLNLVLDKEINRSVRTGKNFSVLFLDIDHFKKVNDLEGHLVGSEILVEMSQILSKEIRTTDYAFRYGGDEFVLILSDSSLLGAKIVAERIRKGISKTKFVGGNSHLDLTVSIGIAVYPDHAKSAKDIVRMADEAMYSAKKRSRNLVYVAAS